MLTSVSNASRDGCLSHGGGDTGFRSYVLLLPDDDIGVVLASNWTGTDTGALARDLVDVLLAGD